MENHTSKTTTTTEINNNINTNHSKDGQASVLVENVKPVLVIRSSELETDSSNEEKQRAKYYRRVIIRKKSKRIVNSPIMPYVRSPSDTRSNEQNYSSHLIDSRPTSSSGIKFIQIKRYIKAKRPIFSNPNMQVYALDYVDSSNTATTSHF